VPATLKEGIGYIDDAMSHASVYVPLNPGDAFIFQAHQRGDILPVVHHFQTVTGPEASDLPRQFAVFRPRLVLPEPGSDNAEEIIHQKYLSALAAGTFYGHPGNELLADTLAAYA
jgi:hypothetical protein